MYVSQFFLSTFIEPEHTSFSPQVTPKRRRRARKRIGVGALLVVLVGALALVIYFSAQKFAAGSDGRSGTVPGEEKPWKLEVVNIAGEDGLAARMTRYLRSMGYDVVDYHSRQLAGYERTVLIDRTGNPSGAQDLAETLGLAPERIVTELNRSLYIDVTVVLGYDYKTITSLKHLERKDTP